MSVTAVDPTARRCCRPRSAAGCVSRVAAPTLWPGAVGELVAKELRTWDAFGFRLDQFGLAWRLVADIEAEQARRREQAEQAWAAGGPHREPPDAVARASPTGLRRPSPVAAVSGELSATGGQS